MKPGEKHSDIPPPTDPATMPPPPGETRENDVLERRKKFSWKSFGGDGFLVSVAFHVILAIIAIFYVVSRYRAPDKKTDPDIFATGAGGGANGEKPKSFEQKLQTKRTDVKMPARIASKAASAIALPDTARTDTASFASGLTSGGMSKGSGGGTGGGEGTGIGIGKGGGRNFVSLFGRKDGGAGLVGSFYDLKINPKKKSTGLDVPNSKEFREAIDAFIHGDWSQTKLDSRYYRCDTRLVSTMFMIPQMHTTVAPKSFEADANVGLENWMVVYRGRVKAPFSGEFRFVGYMADCLAVRFDGKLSLVSEHASFPLPRPTGSTVLYRAKFGGSSDIIRAGSWIKVEKGREYDIQVALVDAIPGIFRCFLMFEKKGAEYAAAGNMTEYPVFRVDNDYPAPLTGSQQFPPHSEEGEIFRAVPVKNLVR